MKQHKLEYSKKTKFMINLYYFFLVDNINMNLSDCPDYVSKEKRQVALYLCFSITSLFVYVLYTQSLNNYDSILAASGSFVSSTISMLMIYPHCLLLNIFHVLIVVVLFFSIWAENKYIIAVFFYIIMSFHTLWYIYGKCIIFKEDESWGLEIPQYITAYIWTAILGYKLIV